MNDPQVMQLQKQAAQRVQRMAEQSRRLVREHPVTIYRGTTLTPQPSHEPPCQPSVCEQPCGPQPCEQTVCDQPTVCCESEMAAHNSCDRGLLSFLTGDTERVLLLLLILMLGKNGAPAELLLVLLYIAL